MDKNAELAERVCIALISSHPELMKETRLSSTYLHGKYRDAFNLIASTESNETFSYDPMEIAKACGEKFRDDIDGFIERNAKLHPAFISDYKKYFFKYEKDVLENYVTLMKEKAAMAVARGEITTIEFNEQCESLEKILLESSHISYNDMYKRLCYASTPIELVHFKDLNRLLKLETTDLVTVGGGTGRGKSSMLMNLAADFSTNPKNNVIYYNLEMNEKQITARMLCAVANGDLKMNECIPDGNGQFSDKVTNVMKSVASRDNFTFVEDKHDIDDIMADARSRFEQGRNNIMVVDYIGLVSTKRQFKDANQTEYAMKQLRLFTKHMGFLTVIGSQLTRESTINGSESVYTFANSSEVERSSTHCIIIKDDPTADGARLEEEFMERPVLLDIVKNRGGHMGKLHYLFMLESQTFKTA